MNGIKKKFDPPALGMMILNQLIPDYDYNYVIGYYEQGYADLVASGNRFIAWLWFWSQVLRSTPVLLLNKSNWSLEMFRNYLKIAIRNILKNRLYSSLNIAGLALGISCSLLMIFHVKDEISYESNFPKAERIYRVIRDFSPGGGSTWAATSIPLAIELKNRIPEVEHSCRFRWAYPQVLSYTPEGGIPRQFEETKGYFVDSTAVNMFDLEFLNGDPGTALDRIYSIVITESMAKRYFGEEDPMEKNLLISDFRNPCIVKGVIKDMPFNTHLQFDYLISFSTFNLFMGPRGRANKYWSALYSYILIGENHTKEDVEVKMEEFTVDFRLSIDGSREEVLNNVMYKLQPVRDIHLHSNLEKEMSVNSSVIYVYIFSVVAVFLLIIAGVNFINITNATALKRLREIGVRKVLGARKNQLIGQFLGEAYLLTVVGGMLGILILWMFIPYYQSISGREIDFMKLLGIENILMITSIVVLLGTFAGVYPAFFVSRFQSVDAFKGLKNPRSSANTIRRGLLVFQFAISIFMIFGTMITVNQMDHFRSKDLGFNKERVVAVSLFGELSRSVVRNMDLLKSELTSYHGIESIATSSTMPGKRFGWEGIIPVNVIDGRNNYSARFMRSDEGFVKTFDIEITEGRDFRQMADPENNIAFLVNEAFVAVYELQNPVGTICREMNSRLTGEIVGVMKDFNYASLHNAIDPLVIAYRPQQANYLMVKISGNDVRGEIEFIQEKINSIAPGQLFSYSFVVDVWSDLYRTEDIMSSIFKVFSILAIIISCLGLFGLSTYTAELRTKEMGVRKVLGASGTDIIASFSREFILWIALANVIALPLAWYVMKNWLQNFAYRISIGLDTLFISMAAALLVALITISYQAVKTAWSNPVNSLRYE